jgi:hypothetical protein
MTLFNRNAEQYAKQVGFDHFLNKFFKEDLKSVPGIQIVLTHSSLSSSIYSNKSVGIKYHIDLDKKVYKQNGFTTILNETDPGNIVRSFFGDDIVDYLAINLFFNDANLTRIETLSDIISKKLEDKLTADEEVLYEKFKKSLAFDFIHKTRNLKIQLDRFTRVCQESADYYSLYKYFSNWMGLEEALGYAVNFHYLCNPKLNLEDVDRALEGGFTVDEMLEIHHKNAVNVTDFDFMSYLNSHKFSDTYNLISENLFFNSFSTLFVLKSLLDCLAIDIANHLWGFWASYLTIIMVFVIGIFDPIFLYVLKCRKSVSSNPCQFIFWHVIQYTTAFDGTNKVYLSLINTDQGMHVELTKEEVGFTLEIRSLKINMQFQLQDRFLKRNLVGLPLFRWFFINRKRLSFDSLNVNNKHIDWRCLEFHLLNFQLNGLELKRLHTAVTFACHQFLQVKYDSYLGEYEGNYSVHKRNAVRTCVNFTYRSLQVKQNGGIIAKRFLRLANKFLIEVEKYRGLSNVLLLNDVEIKVNVNSETFSYNKVEKIKTQQSVLVPKYMDAVPRNIKVADCMAEIRSISEGEGRALRATAIRTRAPELKHANHLAIIQRHVLRGNLPSGIREHVDKVLSRRPNLHLLASQPAELRFYLQENRDITEADYFETKIEEVVQDKVTPASGIRKVVQFCPEGQDTLSFRKSKMIALLKKNERVIKFIVSCDFKGKKVKLRKELDKHKLISGFFIARAKAKAHEKKTSRQRDIIKKRISDLEEMVSNPLAYIESEKIFTRISQEDFNSLSYDQKLFVMMIQPNIFYYSLRCLLKKSGFSTMLAMERLPRSRNRITSSLHKAVANLYSLTASGN